MIHRLIFQITILAVILGVSIGREGFCAEFKSENLSVLRFDTLFRGYYMNDVRIRWSGQEATFGVEAIIHPYIEKEYTWGNVVTEGEFFLNQPFSDNILEDEIRKPYRSHFDVETFEITRLNIRVNRKRFTLTVGKKDTPFGRVYFPSFINSRIDSPFIRNESILWWETGVFLDYKRDDFIATFAVTNGDTEKDTNSTKAGIVRLGIDREKWSLGISGKIQDGTGSSEQKTNKNHAGIDFMVKHTPYEISGEFIYDEYGLRFDLTDDEITWRRSLYFRDVYYKNKLPIHGFGGYINIGYLKPKWRVDLNYGEYHPQKIDHPYHDGLIRRSIIKFLYHVNHGLEITFAGLLENERKMEEWRQQRNNVMVLFGLQYQF